MSKINWLDSILLKWNYNLIENKLRIFYLIFQIFSENLLNFSFPNVLSNENFGFLPENKEKYLKNSNSEDISPDIIIPNIEEDDDNDNIEFISSILDDQLNLNDKLKSKYFINNK